MNLDLAEQIVYVYLMRILGGFGVIGNVIILSVLLKKTLTESSYIYLTAMTGFDICVNLLAIAIGFIRCNHCEVNFEEKYLGGIFEIFVFLPLINMAATASLWTVLAMAIERYIFVAHPITGKTFCRRRTARMVILVICILSVLLNSPRYFFYQVTDDDDDGSAASGSMFSATLNNNNNINNNDSVEETSSNRRYCEQLATRVTFIDSVVVSWNLKTHPPDNDNDDDVKTNPFKFHLFCINRNKTLEVTFHRQIRDDSEIGIGGSKTNNSSEYFRKCCGFLDHHWITAMNPLNENKHSFQIISPRNLSENGKEEEKEEATNISHERSFSIISAAVEITVVNVTEVKYGGLILEEQSVGNITSENYFTIVSTFEGISFLALVYFNSRLVLLLRRHNHKRRVIVISFRNKTFNANQVRDEIRLSVTLIAIIISAVFTNASTLLASEPVGHLIYGQSYKQNQVYRVFVLVANLAVLSSSSFNFLIYAIFNSRFKQEFRKIYCQKYSFFGYCISNKNYNCCCCQTLKQDSTKRITRICTKSVTSN